MRMRAKSKREMECVRRWLSCPARGHGDDGDISAACEPLSFFIFSAHAIRLSRRYVHVTPVQIRSDDNSRVADNP